MTVKEIVAGWLKEHGYDGLYCDECGCIIDDLMPCGGLGMTNWDVSQCEPGYRFPCPPGCGEHDWHVGAVLLTSSYLKEKEGR